MFVFEIDGDNVGKIQEDNAYDAQQKLRTLLRDKEFVNINRVNLQDVQNIDVMDDREERGTYMLVLTFKNGDHATLVFEPSIERLVIKTIDRTIPILSIAIEGAE